jgi:hypothetical protein
MNNTDHISESLKTHFWVKIPTVLKFFVGEAGSGRGKNSEPGSGINIPDQKHAFCNIFILYGTYLCRVQNTN